MTDGHDDCRQEACPNWSGDGNVCPCALFDLTVTLGQLYGIGLSSSDVARDWPDLLDGDEECPGPVAGHGCNACRSDQELHPEWYS